MPAQRKSGFTLVELLVVVSIISILAIIGLTIYTGVQKGARDAKRKADLHAISQALEQYKTANNKYPTAVAGSDWSSQPGWTAANYGLTGYIQELPKDPQNIDLGGCDTVQNCHLYHYCSSDGTYYVVAVNLEGPSSQSTSPSNCQMGGPNNFWIPNQQ